MKAHVQKVAPSSETSFVYRLKADRHFARGLHFHPECELTWIVDSCGHRLVGDSVEEYQSGDCVLLGANVPHAWRSVPPSGPGRGRKERRLHRAIVVQFRPDFLGSAFLQAPELAQISALLERARLGLRITGVARDDVARSLRSMKHLHGLDRLLELLRVLRVISLAGRNARTIATRSLLVAPRPAHLARIDRIVSYLEANFARTPSQSQAARLLGMTPASFSRFFRGATGRTFVNYLSELRVSQASRLLRETDRPVTQIGLESGFNNLSNFNRRFLALRGLPPSAYRARHVEACRELPEA